MVVESADLVFELAHLIIELAHFVIEPGNFIAESIINFAEISVQVYFKGTGMQRSGHMGQFFSN